MRRLIPILCMYACICILIWIHIHKYIRIKINIYKILKLILTCGGVRKLYLQKVLHNITIRFQHTLFNSFFPLAICRVQ